jgi:pyruvate,orthophosphate dikinase
MGWADKFAGCARRYPLDAKIARQFGAEGIGLCRTEHMPVIKGWRPAR